MMLRLFTIVCIVALAQAMVHVVVHDCGSKDATINDIWVDECDSEPCVVHKGQDYTVHVNFTAKSNIQEAHNVLHGGLGFLSLPFPLTPENACSGSVTCPMVAGQTYTYTNTMTCPTFAPNIQVTAKWEVKDEHNHDIFCFAVKLSIHS